MGEEGRNERRQTSAGWLWRGRREKGEESSVMDFIYFPLTPWSQSQNNASQ
jgi:hypothetical protein